MSKRKIIILFLFIPALFVSGQTEMPEQYEKFDPVTQLDEEFLPINKGSMIEEIITDIDPRESEEKDSVQYVNKSGFKIQVISTKDFFVSDSVLKETKEVFGENNAERIYSSPYYKIRVGNCETRIEAKELLDRVKNMGYQGAWIIPTDIRIKQRKSLMIDK